MRLTLPHASENRLAVLTDIHGEADLLRHALDAIERPEDTHLIMLGDYLDRGEQNREVLRILRDLESSPRFRELTLLPGNHDQLAFLGLTAELGLEVYGDSLRGTVADIWMTSGGALTFREFDFDFRSLYDAFPAQLIERLKGSLPLYAEDGDLLFVHAGIDKDHEDVQDFLTLDIRQLHKGPLWIRDDFLFNDAPSIGPSGRPVTVFHGHTRLGRNEPEGIREKIASVLETYGRVGLDTTRSGHLALAQIEGDQMDLTVIGPNGPEPERDAPEP